VSGRILVTPRSLTRDGHPALDRFTEAGYEVVFCTTGQQPAEAELLQLLPGCVGYLAGVEPITAGVLEAAPQLKVISRNGTGVSSIDIETARRLGITVVTTPGANARGVAELAMAHLLALARGLTYSDRSLKMGGFDRAKGFELKGKQLGLVGCGAIGRTVSELAIAFGMSVRAFDPYPDNTFCPEGFVYADLDQVLAESDAISLHCPPPADGTPLVAAAFLGRMKPGALLVNTARGELLDEDAVLEALEAGQLAGLGLDAYREEPPADRRLVKHERVVATAHAGGFTKESINRAVDGAVDNLLEALRA
jgi:D-3-phosphoglycerate dehydrogenase